MAIRTVVLEREAGTAVYGSGGGITCDSDRPRISRSPRRGPGPGRPAAGPLCRSVSGRVPVEGR
nr:hypothetical protein [Geodermatophilus ruber]